MEARGSSRRADGNKRKCSRWKFVEVHGSMRKTGGAVNVDGGRQSRWRLVEVYGSRWIYMEVDGIRWKLVEVYGR